MLSLWFIDSFFFLVKYTAFITLVNPLFQILYSFSAPKLLSDFFFTICKSLLIFSISWDTSLLVSFNYFNGFFQLFEKIKTVDLKCCILSPMSRLFQLWFLSFLGGGRVGHTFPFLCIFGFLGLVCLFVCFLHLFVCFAEKLIFWILYCGNKKSASSPLPLPKFCCCCLLRAALIHSFNDFSKLF